jgi:ABC-2 type transport system permease protein
MIVILKLKIMNLRNDIKMIGLMTVMTLVMIAVFASIDYSSDAIVYGYIDEDKSEISGKLYEELNKQEGYRFDEFSLEEAKEAVKDGDISGAFYINKNFMSNVLTNNNVKIERLLVSENMNNIQMNSLIKSSLKSVVLDYKMALGLTQLAVQFSDNKIPIDDKMVTDLVYDTIDEHWTYKKPIIISELEMGKGIEFDSVKYSVIGFSLFFAMFTIIFAISEILTEKENHTWDRQMVSPLSKFSILMGNIMGTFIIGFVQVSLMFLVSKYLFKVDWQGNMLHLLLIIAAFVFCVTALGLLLSNFVKTIGQLSAVAPIVITGTAMLGGCFWPLEIIDSKVMLMIANITPQKWAVSSIQKIVVYGYGFNEVVLGFTVLIAMGIVYTLMGTFLLNRNSI